MYPQPVIQLNSEDSFCDDAATVRSSSEHVLIERDDNVTDGCSLHTLCGHFQQQQQHVPR